MSETDTERALAVLKNHWGYNSFRPGQLQIILDVAAGKDVLAVLPTGTGKSVCYQVPAMLRPGVTIVVSPLVALMRDQVDRLRSVGVPAAAISATTRITHRDEIRTATINGTNKLLYLAPERLRAPGFVEWSTEMNVALLAVDEAHCISEWGHEFRPSYRAIGLVRRSLGDPPVLALTATATPRIRKDIYRSLGLREARVVVAGFDRPNIYLCAKWSSAKHRHLAGVLSALRGSAIVYAATRRSTEGWASWLSSAGFAAEAYHAGMPQTARNQVQDRWARSETRIVVATNAFGMGVDKADVRLVAHVHIPATLESYYQQAGRAGRDSSGSTAILLFNSRDIVAARRLVAYSRLQGKTSRPTDRFKRAVRYRQAIERLNSVVSYASSRSCRRNHILTYFGDNPRATCRSCDNCRPSPSRLLRPQVAPK